MSRRTVAESVPGRLMLTSVGWTGENITGLEGNTERGVSQ